MPLTDLHTVEQATDISQTILREIEAGNNPSLKSILETALNLVMRAERNVHTASNAEDKGNGYYQRQLGTPIGNLSLDVPRDRDGDFRPQVLPQPHYRDCKERYALLESMLINSYSPNAILRSLQKLEMHYSAKELEQLKSELFEEFSIWQKRQLPKDVIGLFVDVYCAQAMVDKEVKKVAIYVIIGVDFSGTKSLFGIYMCVGNENKEYWLKTLNQVINRGVKRPLFIISDDFPGLKSAVATLFPKAMHQLCVIHMQRNVKRHMGRQDTNDFNNEIKSIRIESSFHRAKERFLTLCDQYEETYTTFIQGLKQDVDNYFAYLHLPKDAQKHFYTTNIVESANSSLEKIRQRMGGFFQSEPALFTNVYITFRGIQERKWQKGIPMVKKNLYDFRQCFAQRYDELPETPKE